MKLQKIIASGLGSGYAPVASGTFGSAVGVALLYGFNTLLSHYNIIGYTSIGFNLLLALVFTFVGVWSIKHVHNIWNHDDGKIVIDEIAGMAVTMLAIPLDWRYYILGFFIFRFFDILKPFGIRKIDMKSGDWSVMLDDILAGIYSWLVLVLLVRFVI